ncbi:MAG: hypothetical protein WC728_08555 [Elusimicrobiota bacterium]
MRVIPAVLAAVLVLQVQSFAQTQSPQQGEERFSALEMEAAKADPKYYTLDAASIEIVPLGPAVSPSVLPEVTIPKPPSGQGGTIPGTPPIPPIGGGGQDPLVVIDHIINIAQKIWQIIEQNKPVVDIKTTYATAVPDGITHWTQLAQWKPPEGTTYAFYAKNAYGVKTVDVKFVVFRTCGGTYKGKGKYLTGVTVEPVSVSVAWGYKFSMNAEVPSVANVGTAEDPIASMMSKLNWKIATVLKEEQGTSIYYLQGDGVFRELAGPFKSAAREKVRESLENPKVLPSVAPGMKMETLRKQTAVGW